MDNYYAQNGQQNQGQQFQGGMGVPNQFMNNGMVFTPVNATVNQNISNDDLSKIIVNGSKVLTFTELDQIKAAWNLRDGTALKLEMVDPATDRVRAADGTEFNMVIASDEVIQALFNLVHNVVYTAKTLNTTVDPEISKQVYIGWGLCEKLMPDIYKAGKNKYNSVIGQINNQSGNVGYQGQYGGVMYNGMYGNVASYNVNNGSVAPVGQYNNGMYGQQQMYGQPNGQQYYGQQVQQMDPQIQNAINLLQSAGMTVNAGNAGGMVVNGGTMLNGGNGFVQGGQPQQPPINMPSVPQPGQPQPTPQLTTVPNPSIGGEANKQQSSTTASSPF